METKPDYVVLGTNENTLKDELKEKLKEEQQNATLERYPFCYKAATVQIEEELRQYYERLAQGYNSKKPEINEGWLAPFKDLKNFDVIGKPQPAFAKVLVGIATEQQLIGHHITYKFKGTKFHVSIFQPLEETKKITKTI